MSDTDDSRAWEPWTPRIGDRVVCRPSPECRALFRWALDWSPTGEEPAGHSPEEYGVTGVVVPYGGDVAPSNPDHPILVRFDRLVRNAGQWIDHAPYASCELEPTVLREDQFRVCEREGQTSDEGGER